MTNTNTSSGLSSQHESGTPDGFWKKPRVIPVGRIEDHTGLGTTGILSDNDGGGKWKPFTLNCQDAELPEDV